MTPRVTVLMPVYNASLFLREAMDSIIGQTLPDFEFLIINDGSTDETAAIIRTYNDRRIRYIEHTVNRGITATLNEGINEACSSIIARMDADDISYRERLEEQVSYLERNASCAMVASWAQIINDAAEPVHTEKYKSGYYYYNLNFECWIYHPTVAFLKEAVIACGMYSKPYSEDYDLFWKIARAYKIHTIEKVLVNYRLSPVSLHSVLRKEEYAVANRENVLRNLRYFMGESFDPPEDHLECWRHNFEPIVRKRNIANIMDCISALDAITAAVLAKPNPNLRESETKEAADHKRNFIVRQVASRLTSMERVRLSILTKKPELVTWRISKAMRWISERCRQYFGNTRKPGVK